MDTLDILSSFRQKTTIKVCRGLFQTVRRSASKTTASHREYGKSDEGNVRFETLGMTTGSKMS